MKRKQRQAKQLENSAAAELLKRPGALPKTGGSERLLRQAKLEKGSSRLREALSRSPLFQSEVWARLVLSSLVAINRLLGKDPARMPGELHHSRKGRPTRQPMSKERAEDAQEVLRKLLSLLGEVTEQRVAASLVLTAEGRKRLTAQARRVIEERRRSLVSEQDAVLYPSQVFTKENPFVRLR
jgi:hypothetical protein